MNLLPIVHRELIVAARRVQTHVARVSWALIGVLLCGLMIWTTALLMPPAVLGGQMFAMLSGFAFLCAILSGPAFTADSLSEEKREGTLGLLFLTGLKPHDVVLGKMVSNGLASVYGVLAFFPIMAIPLLLGGVALQQVGKVFAVLLTAIFFSLSVGLFVSSISKENRKATAATALLLALFTLGFPALGHAWYSDMPGPTPAWFLLPSPGFALVTVLNGTGASAWLFWSSLVTINSLACVFLLLAARIARGVWRERARSARGEARWRRSQRWNFGNPSRRAEHRRRTLNENPATWLEQRYLLQRSAVLLFILVFFAIWAWQLARDPSAWLVPPITVFTALLLFGIFKIWMASQTTRRLIDDRRSGALELLLTTPLTSREIVGGLLTATRRQFLMPGLLLLGLLLLLLLAQSHLLQVEWRNRPDDMVREFMIVGLIGMAMFVADTVTIAWLGLWESLRARTNSQASGAVILKVLLIPWLLFMGVVAVSELALHKWRILLVKDYFYPWIWLAIGLTVNAALLFPARQKLYRQLRWTVAQWHLRGGLEGLFWIRLARKLRNRLS
jgi:ABC-type transport system involved in multi-copper enzyme maturation permease subunit